MLTNSHFFFSKKLDLSKLVKIGKVFQSEKEVTIGLTVNRTGKSGDDILSTPGMLEEMSKLVCLASDTFLPDNSSTIVKSVKLNHRKPLKHGEKFILETEAVSIDDQFVDFSIKAINPTNKQILGDAIIKVEVTRK